MGGGVEVGVGIKKTLTVLSTESHTELLNPYSSTETTKILYVH